MADQYNTGEDKEIDFSQVSKKVKGLFSGIENFFFSVLVFARRHAIVLAVLFLAGAGYGYYLDKKMKVYNNQTIVMPNFGSTDYLYSKIELLSSKISEGDTAFIKSIGFKNPKKIVDIEIEPVNNVYDFVNQRPTNFELLKLMAEDGNITKVIEDPITGKNYSYHSIVYTTLGTTDKQRSLDPLMKFLNDSQYYDTIKKEQTNNLNVKLQLNDSVINQIDGIITEFATVGSGSKSNSQVYINENSQLNEILKRKDELINEQAALRVSRINYDTIIKNTSATLNILNKKGLNGKKKYLYPILLVGVYMAIVLFVAYLRRQFKTRNN
jgi:hypothetical protein